MTTKFKERYVVPIETDEAKQKIRKWVGTHNGMSILKTDWIYDPTTTATMWSTHTDVYLLGITNPRTELLFLLSFPAAKKEEEIEAEGIW